MPFPLSPAGEYFANPSIIPPRCIVSATDPIQCGESSIPDWKSVVIARGDRAGPAPRPARAEQPRDVAASTRTAASESVQCRTRRGWARPTGRVPAREWPGCGSRRPGSSPSTMASQPARPAASTPSRTQVACQRARWGAAGSRINWLSGTAPASSNPGDAGPLFAPARDGWPRPSISSGVVAGLMPHGRGQIPRWSGRGPTRTLIRDLEGQPTSTSSHQPGNCQSPI